MYRQCVIMLSTTGWSFQEQLVAQAHLTHTQRPHAEPHRITLERYMELLDEQLYEVIDGEVIPMTPQQLRSSRIAHDLLFSIERFVRDKELGRVWTETVYALDVAPGTNWVEGSLVPDVSFTSQERLDEQMARYGEEGPLRIAPDLAVELVSPTDKFSLLFIKAARYLEYGTKLVWLIDPQRRAVHVYTPEQPDGFILHDTDALTSDPVLPGWSMAIVELLDGRPLAE
jgi:Uma2 family endonuclease